MSKTHSQPLLLTTSSLLQAFSTRCKFQAHHPKHSDTALSIAAKASTVIQPATCTLVPFRSSVPDGLHLLLQEGRRSKSTKQRRSSAFQHTAPMRLTIKLTANLQTSKPLIVLCSNGNAQLPRASSTTLFCLFTLPQLLFAMLQEAVLCQHRHTVQHSPQHHSSHRAGACAGHSRSTPCHTHSLYYATLHVLHNH
jgi:hypothetical protein